jgi:multidrug efflux system outer membrane protein
VSAQRISPSDQALGFQFDDFDNFEASAGVSWEIDLWGKFRRSNESARSELFATEWGRRALVVSLVSEVARAYFLLRDLDARLEIAQRTLDGRRDSTILIRNRFEGGITSELDVRQAEIEEATAAVAVPAFERQRTKVQNALSVLLGRNPGPIRRGMLLVEQSLPETPPSGIPSELLQRRPDVIQTEELLHAQLARIGVAEALRWPSLSLTGLLGFQSQELSTFTSGSTWNIGAGLVGPIFEFGKNKRRVEVEYARTEQAILGYEATVLDAFREVEDALIAIRTLRQEHDARVMQLNSAQEARRLSRARYDGGVTSYLEVLDIERSLFEAELDASRTLQEHFAAIIDLYAALGGGWEPEEEWTLPASRIVLE